MRIDSTGRLRGVRHCLSPNHDARPDPGDISLLVIHGISLPPGEFGGRSVQQLFCNQLDPSAHPFFEEIKRLRVSAHVFIRRDGQIIQFVPFGARAWHAGMSSFEGRERCNDYSIGIEMEGTDDRPYTQAQYRQLIKVSRRIQSTYPAIHSVRIVGHCDIAPGRKTDPGPSFHWPRFRAGLL
jgi:AmpD protein